jgi:two-component system sensor histidine kinase ArlS
MKIRDKLTFQFCAIVGLILVVSSVSIYFISRQHRYLAFKGRLEEKAINTANLLIQVEQIDHDLLKKLRKNYLQSLPEEAIQIYNKSNNSMIFEDGAKGYKFSKQELEKAWVEGEVHFSSEERQFLAINYKDNYIVVASAKNIYGQKELKWLGIILLLINVLGLLIIFFFGKKFANHALLPISKMVKEVELLGESNLSLRLDEGKRKDEIAKLAITFNKMFDKIEDAFERQKIFVANASHELRTPLTTITGEIEVALMKEREKYQYVEVMLSVLEEAKTLTKLSNNLLKLAQAGNVKGLIVQKISPASLLQKIKEEKEKRYPNRTLHYEIDRKQAYGNLFVNGNMELLKTALLNLIDNAYKFSEFKPVTFSLSEQNGNLIISVKDKGLGMEEDQLEYIFQPFYRGNNAGTIEGTGVGLALTEKIIKLHGGRLEVYSKIASGTEIKVVLPVAKIEID